MTKKMDILVVDDDPDILHVLEAYLRDKFNVTTCGRGDKGWEMVQELKPPLVILDLVLPGMDGLTICSKIKESPDLTDVKVIIITATTVGSDMPDTVWKLGTQADGFVSKPFELSSIAREINRALKDARL